MQSVFTSDKITASKSITLWELQYMFPNRVLDSFCNPNCTPCFWHSSVSRLWACSEWLKNVMILTMESGEIGYQFICKWSAIPPPAPTGLLEYWWCGNLLSDLSKSITRNRLDKTTSNLVRHSKSCGSPILAKSAPISTFDTGTFQYLVAAWSARHARPHAIIEGEELRKILIMHYSATEIHSCQTVACDISDMYERSRHVIALHLQSIKHWLHITLDGWTSPNVFSFLGVTVQY